jgi:hypothetical protein
MSASVVHVLLGSPDPHEPSTGRVRVVART